MEFKFETGRMSEDKFAERKVQSRKNFYAVGMDDKGHSFITNIYDSTLLEAKNLARSWAKQNSLKLQVIRATE